MLQLKINVSLSLAIFKILTQIVLECSESPSSSSVIIVIIILIILIIPKHALIKNSRWKLLPFSFGLLNIVSNISQMMSINYRSLFLGGNVLFNILIWQWGFLFGSPQVEDYNLKSKKIVLSLEVVGRPSHAKFFPYICFFFTCFIVFKHLVLCYLGLYLEIFIRYYRNYLEQEINLL